MLRRGRMLFAYGFLCSGLIAVGGLRQHASRCAQSRPAPVQRRLCLHRGWLAAGRPPLSARTSRSREAAGDPLSRPGTQRHVLDDHRRPSAFAARRAGLRSLRLRHPRLGRKCPASGGATGSTRACVRPSCANGASRAGRSTTWSSTTCRRSSTTSSVRPDAIASTGSDIAWGACFYSTYLEVSPHPERIANFVGMGSTIIQAETPQTDMLRANRGLRLLSPVASPGRLGRPLAFVRIPGMDKIDRFYYSNRECRPAHRFAFLWLRARGYGPGRSAPARPVSQDRPHALGGPHGRLLGDAGEMSTRRRF